MAKEIYWVERVLKEKSKIFPSKTRSTLKKHLRPIFERSEKEGVNRQKE
jgi:hypothetical protein